MVLRFLVRPVGELLEELFSRTLLKTDVFGMVTKRS